MQDRRILSRHASYLLSMPSVMPLFAALRQHIEMRSSCYRKMLALSGRLDLLLSNTPDTIQKRDAEAAVTIKGTRSEHNKERARLLDEKIQQRQTAAQRLKRPVNVYDPSEEDEEKNTEEEEEEDEEDGEGVFSESELVGESELSEEEEEEKATKQQTKKTPKKQKKTGKRRSLSRERKAEEDEADREEEEEEEFKKKIEKEALLEEQEEEMMEDAAEEDGLDEEDDEDDE